MKITKASKAEVAAAARKDFKAFVRFAFNLTHPDIDFHDNFHIDALCHEMEQIRTGKEKRLSINLPPRTLKSFIVSVAFPAFMLGHDPARKFIVVSHNEALAEEHSGQFRKLVSHSAFKTVFPTLNPPPTKDTQRVYVTNKNGGRRAVTTQTGVTGLGADFLIFDDPISADDAANQNRCEKVKNWITKSAMSRLNNAATGVAILVMQRLSIWDPHAAVAQASNWRTLSLPAITDKTRSITTGPISKYTWKTGELLHPTRLPHAYLDEQRTLMGEAAFKAQFLQAPVPGGGGLIDVGKFKLFNKLPKRRPDTVMVSIDPAAGGTYAKSYSVILVFYIFDGHLFLVGRWRRRVEFPKLKTTTLQLIEKYKPDELVIEYASNGPPLASEVDEHLKALRRTDTTIATKLQLFKPTMSKEARWDEASLLVAQGRLHLYPAEENDWVQSLIDECRAFPEGANDDQVDALSQALIAYHRLYDQSHKSKVSLFQLGA